MSINKEIKNYIKFTINFIKAPANFVFTLLILMVNKSHVI